jgi:DNA-binding HxlR family transcriptional regulator
MESQRRYEQYNILWSQCPSRMVIDLIADKWSIMVIYGLSKGTARHSDLHRMIAGISQKMLTQTLRRLEAHGLVKRTVYPVVPPKVEYTLTPLGESLLVPVTALKMWAEDNSDAIEDALDQFARLSPELAANQG